MSCEHPLYGYIPLSDFFVDQNGEFFKERIRFNWKLSDPELKHDEREKLLFSFMNYCKKNDLKFLALPCGKCSFCRLEYARQWATRLINEVSYYDDNSCNFITLTYSDEYVPNVSNIDPYTGELYDFSSFDFEVAGNTLFPIHLVNFLKRIRKISKCRFFACGEYGSKSMRPHYHLILLGYEFSDKKFFKKTPAGGSLFISDELSKLWKCGFSSIGSVTVESCAYVARYCTKKVGSFSDDDYKKSLHIYPEFIRMSRRPGIGFNYVRDHKESLLRDDELYINGDVYKLPRYYDKLLLTSDYDIHNQNKVDRFLRGESTFKNLLSVLDRNYFDYLDDLSYIQNKKDYFVRDF